MQNEEYLFTISIKSNKIHDILKLNLKGTYLSAIFRVKKLYLPSVIRSFHNGICRRKWNEEFGYVKKNGEK